jgi:hypothetical protein
LALFRVGGRIERLDDEIEDAVVEWLAGGCLRPYTFRGSSTGSASTYATYGVLNAVRGSSADDVWMVGACGPIGLSTQSRNVGLYTK